MASVAPWSRYAMTDTRALRLATARLAELCLAAVPHGRPGGLSAVLAAVDSLAEDPRPGSAFPLGMTRMLRLRAGRYPVVYQIDEATRAVSVMHVDRRA
jgi:ParE-like toxin of type II ParDE toxin-antitoxin system